jgi:hypothetical protein
VLDDCLIHPLHRSFMVSTEKSRVVGISVNW